MDTMVPTIPPLVTTMFPFCKSREHLLLLLALPLHRQEQEEVEDGEDEDDGQESPAMELGDAVLAEEG